MREREEGQGSYCKQGITLNYTFWTRPAGHGEFQDVCTDPHLNDTQADAVVSDTKVKSKSALFKQPNITNHNVVIQGVL